MPFSLFFCICPQFAFYCHSWQQGIVRELLQNGCCDATTAPTAMLPGDGQVMSFSLFALLLVDCHFPFVILWHQGMARGLFQKWLLQCHHCTEMLSRRTYDSLCTAVCNDDIAFAGTFDFPTMKAKCMIIPLVVLLHMEDFCVMSLTMMICRKKL